MTALVWESRDTPGPGNFGNLLTWSGTGLVMKKNDNSSASALSKIPLKENPTLAINKTPGDSKAGVFSEMRPSRMGITFSKAARWEADRLINISSMKNQIGLSPVGIPSSFYDYGTG